MLKRNWRHALEAAALLLLAIALAIWMPAIADAPPDSTSDTVPFSSN